MGKDADIEALLIDVPNGPRNIFNNVANKLTVAGLPNGFQFGEIFMHFNNTIQNTVPDFPVQGGLTKHENADIITFTFKGRFNANVATGVMVESIRHVAALHNIQGLEYSIIPALERRGIHNA